jgi:hypothetical protein
VDVSSALSEKLNIAKLAILKSFIGNLEQQTLCRIHARRLLGGDRKERGIKARWVFPYEEATVMVDLKIRSAQFRIATMNKQKCLAGSSYSSFAFMAGVVPG